MWLGAARHCSIAGMLDSRVYPHDSPVRHRENAFTVRTLLLGTTLILMSMTVLAQAPIAIAIHGGAGTIERGNLNERQETAIRAALSDAIDAGHRVLADGGSSLDAVVAAIRL